MTGLSIQNICKTFGETRALDDVTLDIAQGELFFLLGPSGCGKTTLLRSIAGLITPDSGSIAFQGENLLTQPIEKRNIGMVFQNYSLWPHMTVFNNVAYGLKMRKIPRDEISHKVTDALAMVDMTGTGHRRPGELSGGQQQRIALARALVYNPALLLLDEPLSNLDAKLRREMRTEIGRLHQQLSITMIYVTHDQEEAIALADRLAILNNGKIVQAGTPAEIASAPATPFVADFMESAIRHVA